MAIPVITGPLEGARATGARPHGMLVWLERAAGRGGARARIREAPGRGRHLYRVVGNTLWYAGLTDAKCASCGLDHVRYDRAGRHENCGFCGGELVSG